MKIIVIMFAEFFNLYGYLEKTSIIPRNSPVALPNRPEPAIVNRQLLY
jgi:hypothetical protein